LEKNAKPNLQANFIIGDFNIILNAEIESEELLNHFLTNGCIPLSKSITRPNDNGGTSIDNMYVKFYIN
jgi:hypothetical protein